tara:strand:+ start:545 stop:718 length:174 start_codon:yes stop_codon:yes gene_type:complete
MQYNSEIMATKNTNLWQKPEIENLGKLVDMTKASEPGDTKDVGSFDGERFAGQDIGS